MRKVNRIIVHCSATNPSQDIGADIIRHWHKFDRGWSDIGYHYVIRRDGRLEHGRPIEREGAHAKGHNGDSIGICLVGGVNKEGKADANYTYKQYATLRHTINNLMNGHSDLEVLGHRDLPGVNRDCPCFDVRSFISCGTQY